MNNKDKWVELTLAQVGESANGDVYPEHVLQAAIDTLANREPKRPLRGEYNLPQRRAGEGSREYIERFNRIDENQVSHLIDTTTLRIKDGKVVGKVIPHGPMGYIARHQIADNDIQFGIRAAVRFKEGNTTRTRNLTAEHCDIISFDLINPDN
jgi:hypothetical protein